MERIRDTVFEVIARYMNGTISLEAAEKQISWLNRLCAGANAQEEKNIKIKRTPIGGSGRAKIKRAKHLFSDTY